MRKPVKVRLISYPYNSERVEKIKKILDEIIPSSDSTNLPTGELEVARGEPDVLNNLSRTQTEINFIDFKLGRSKSEKCDNECIFAEQIHKTSPNAINIVLSSSKGLYWTHLDAIFEDHIQYAWKFVENPNPQYVSLLKGALGYRIAKLVKDNSVLVPISFGVIGTGKLGVPIVKAAADAKSKRGSFDKIGIYCRDQTKAVTLKKFLSAGGEGVSFHTDLSELVNCDVIVNADGFHVKDYGRFKCRGNGLIRTLTMGSRKKVCGQSEILRESKSLYIPMTNAPEVFARDAIERSEYKGCVSTANIDLARLYTFVLDVANDPSIIEDGPEAYLNRVRYGENNNGNDQIQNLYWWGMHGIGVMDHSDAKCDIPISRLFDLLRDNEKHKKFMNLFRNLGLYLMQAPQNKHFYH